LPTSKYGYRQTNKVTDRHRRPTTTPCRRQDATRAAHAPATTTPLVTHIYTLVHVLFLHNFPQWPGCDMTGRLSVCVCLWVSCDGPEDKCSSWRWRWRDGLSTTQYVLNDVSSRCTTTTRQTAIIDDHSASHNRLSAPTHTTHCLDMTSFWDTDNETVYRIREMTFNITQCHPSTTLDHLDFLSETRTVGNSCLQIILSEMTLKVIRGHWCRQPSVCHITSNSIIGSGLW